MNTINGGASLKSLSSIESGSRSGKFSAFKNGMRDGIPIGLGYLGVSFSLGIAAKNAALTAFQGFLTSALVKASAGQYAGFIVMAASPPYVEMIIVTFIANIRYSLMSFAMSQRMNPDTPWYHRLLMGDYITDEIFAISIARPGYLDPFYTYGAALVAIPSWAIGTALGIIAGNILHMRDVSALSVALYVMFLDLIIPPARDSKVLTGLILVCFASSFASSVLPWLSTLSEGSRTIILTISISSIVAVLFPRNWEGEGT
ncbi:AzlC family ABC transporter permease [Candidatus Saccharibacteria bacterium]|nr:AzlC family ABC transporter permease [Candidatus Saccharibacteria bacterium]